MSCCVHLEAGAELWRKRVTGEVSISRTCGHHHPSSGKKNPPPLVASPFLCVFSLPSSLSFRCCDCSSALQAPFCWRVSPRWPNVGSARTSNCLRTAQVHNRTQLRTCTAAARLLLQVNVVRLYFAAVVSHLALARIHASSARSVCTKPAHLSLINCIPCLFFFWKLHK